MEPSWPTSVMTTITSAREKGYSKPRVPEWDGASAWTDRRRRPCPSPRASRAGQSCTAPEARPDRPRPIRSRPKEQHQHASRRSARGRDEEETHEGDVGVLLDPDLKVVVDLAEVLPRRDDLPAGDVVRSTLLNVRVPVVDHLVERGRLDLALYSC
jgi:hypothetical protein